MLYLEKWREGLQELSDAAGFKEVRWGVITSLAFYKIGVSDIDMKGECLLFFLNRWKYVASKYRPELGTSDEYLFRCFYNAARLVVTRAASARKMPKSGFAEMPLDVTRMDGLDDAVVRFISYLEGLGYQECLSMFRHLMSGGTVTTFSKNPAKRKRIYHKLHNLARNWAF